MEVLSERFSLPLQQRWPNNVWVYHGAYQHRGTQNWWLGMRRIVVQAHTDLCNNAIKNKQIKFKGDKMKWGFVLHLRSINQKKDQWTEEDSKNLPVSVYPVKKIDEELKRRRRLTPALLQNFPASTLYVLQEQGCPWQWGRLWLVGAWHEKIRLIIYSGRSRTIERNLPQHSTRNSWKCFCCNKRRSQARGLRNYLIRSVKMPIQRMHGEVK